MAVTQLDKGNSFRAIHQGSRAFVIANAWDAGSARVLAGLGFAAIATSSYATAGAYGTRDGRITRDQVLAHARVEGQGNLQLRRHGSTGVGGARRIRARVSGLCPLPKIVAAQLPDADDRPEPRQHVGSRHLRTETVRWMKCARSTVRTSIKRSRQCSIAGSPSVPSATTSCGDG
jgi:hypothetical protein